MYCGTVSPYTAFNYGKDNLKVQKVYKRDSYKPRIYKEPVYVVAVYLDIEKWDMKGWYYISLAYPTNNPTTYHTKKEAKELLKWIKTGCNEENKVEDV